MFGDALRSMQAELVRFDATARVIRFAPEVPLPAVLIQKIVRFRFAEIDGAVAAAQSKISYQRR